MITIRKIIKRDLKRAIRSGGSWAYGLIFMLIFLSLSAIALNGEFATLRKTGPALIWTAFAFSTLMSADRALAEDIADGTTGQLWLSGFDYLHQSVAAIISFLIINLLPLLLTVPIWSILFDLEAKIVIGLIISIFISLPGLAAYTVFAGALTGDSGKASFIAIFISAPLLIPFLIFGLSATQSYGDAGVNSLEFRVLAGLSLIALALSIPSTASALRIHTDK